MFQMPVDAIKYNFLDVWNKGLECLSISGFVNFNITWEARCGKILPGLEFFGFSAIFFVIPIDFEIFPLEFNFSKIFVKRCHKKCHPLKNVEF